MKQNKNYKKGIIKSTMKEIDKMAQPLLERCDEEKAKKEKEILIDSVMNQIDRMAKPILDRCKKEDDNDDNQ